MFLIAKLIDLYTLIIIIRAILSWINIDRTDKFWNDITRIFRNLTEPVLRPFRRLVPPEKTGHIDISPILAIITLQIVKKIIYL